MKASRLGRIRVAVIAKPHTDSNSGAYRQHTHMRTRHPRRCAPSRRRCRWVRSPRAARGAAASPTSAPGGSVPEADRPASDRSHAPGRPPLRRCERAGCCGGNLSIRDVVSRRGPLLPSMRSNGGAFFQFGVGIAEGRSSPGRRSDAFCPRRLPWASQGPSCRRCCSRSPPQGWSSSTHISSCRSPSAPQPGRVSVSSSWPPACRSL